MLSFNNPQPEPVGDIFIINTNHNKPVQMLTAGNFCVEIERSVQDMACIKQNKIDKIL